MTTTATTDPRPQSWRDVKAKFKDWAAVRRAAKTSGELAGRTDNPKGSNS